MDRHPDEKDKGGPLETSSPLSPDNPPIDELTVEETEAAIDAAGEIRSGKLAGKTMWAAIWILAIPVLLQQTMTAFVGMADTIIAGRLPDDIVVSALDGIGIGSYIQWFIGIAMTGLGIGSQALIARAVGGGRVSDAHHALGQAMTLSALWGVVVAVALWSSVGPIAAFCKLSDASAIAFSQYVRTISFAMPLAGMMMVGGMCLHGAGETTKPSLIAVGVNLVNIVFSWLFSGVDVEIGGTLLVNPFPWDLNVIGIAIGTAIGYGFGAVLTLIVLVRGVKDLRLERRELTLRGATCRRIVRIGIPGFFESMMMWSVNLFVLVFIGMIAATRNGNGEPGEGLQGAHLIAIRWESFSFLLGFAMGTAAGALAGQYLGAGNPRKAQQAILACTGVAVVIMGLLGIVFATGGELLTRIISDEPIHLREVPDLLLICGVVQIFFATTMVIRQGLRGVGDTKWTFIITTASSYLIRLPAAWFFGVYLDMGLRGIWIGLCGEFVIRAILFSMRYMHGGWKRVRV